MKFFFRSQKTLLKVRKSPLGEDYRVLNNEGAVLATGDKVFCEEWMEKYSKNLQAGEID